MSIGDKIMMHVLIIKYDLESSLINIFANNHHSKTVNPLRKKIYS